MAGSKSYVSRIFLCVEIVIFLGVYYFGVDGVKNLSSLSEENLLLDREIAQLQNEIAVYEREIVAWNSDPFYKEKVAREQLQMARADDEIFFIK